MELKKHVSDISKIIAPSQIAMLKGRYKKLPGSGKFQGLSLNRKDNNHPLLNQSGEFFQLFVENKWLYFV
jgi:hypothetical protein